MDRVDKPSAPNYHDRCYAENNRQGYQALSLEIENYLKRLNDEPSYETVNPKLKAEKRKLLDLLESYKKLCQRLDQKCEEASAQGIPVPSTKELVARLPEIYAVLHPDLYRDVRDEEKKRLIEKFSKKRIFSTAQKVIPPNPATSVRQVSDLRQKEKDRFCRLIACAPTRFHNAFEPTSLAKKRVLKKNQSVVRVKEDVRESEKERLARIFATSTVFLKNPGVQKKIVQRLNGIKSVEKHSEATDGRVCNFAPFERGLNQENSKDSTCVPTVTSDLPQIETKMVRMGEYSPLNQKNANKGRTELGVGEHEETKGYLDRERKQEYQDFVAREKQRDKVDKSVMAKLCEERPLTSMSTVSTQTDDSLEVLRYNQSQLQSPECHARLNEPNEISPRDKLIYDLYGAPSHLRNFRPNTYEELVQEEKRKQIAYAEALKRQIEEKNRLEEEKKRKEKEEEDFYERKFKEQAERLQVQYANERLQKHDTEIQRQAQEEFMRKKLKELSLEAEALKKKEKLQKVQWVEQGTSRASSRLSQGPRQVTQPVKRSETQSRPHDLPEDLKTNSDKYVSNLAGVDLLREYRNSEERANRTPERESGRPLTAESQQSNSGYIPSMEIDLSRKPRTTLSRGPNSVAQPSSVRSPSPVLPAVRTEMLVKRNSKILDDKKGISDLDSEKSPSKVTTPENILTQLGAFRRQLAREHYRLEQKFKGQSS